MNLGLTAIRSSLRGYSVTVDGPERGFTISMMIMVRLKKGGSMRKSAHTHKFVKPKSIKVTLVAGKRTAVDTIKQRVCECGKSQAYDMIRDVK